ncbi:hypothetical protein ZWY2020_024753 [Hordeum vulgare]|nr:hypothetical protein ZWY2020_024753 [Hordeum vulgare]
MPFSSRDGLMCEFNGDLNHPQCFYNVRLEEEDFVEIVKKLSGEPVENCSKIGLKPLCISNPAPEKGSAFWNRRPKTVVKKVPKPAPKKKKTRGKATTKESFVVGESRIAEEQLEDDDIESQDEDVEVISISSDSNSSPPSRAQAKKRKTGESSSAPKAAQIFGMTTSIPEAQDKPVETHVEAFDDFPNIRGELPNPQKESTKNLNLPSSHKAAEDVMPDPDPVVGIGTGFSKLASVVLTKHAPKDALVCAEKDMIKLKLPNFEKLEFDELYSGFVSRLETSHEMEKAWLT